MADLPAGATVWDPETLSCLTDVSCAPSRCQCGARWTCAECRAYWVSRRVRTSQAWLQQSLDAGGVAWFGLLTIPTAGELMNETEELWRRWRIMGRERAADRRRKRPKTGLVGIRRGMAALHLVNSAGRWQPHLHAVLAVDAQSDATAILDAWQALGRGFADVSPAASLGAVVRYSIAGELPDSDDDRAELARMMRGRRVVRRIGR